MTNNTNTETIKSKKILSVSDFVTTVQAYAEDCFDNYAQQKSLAFGGDGYDMSFKTGEDVPLFGTAVAQAGKLNDWAFNQVNNRLGGPNTAWIQEDAKCSPELRSHILNTLVADRELNPRLLVRNKGMGIRAVLSDEYTPFDSNKVVELIDQALDKMQIAKDSVQVRRYIVGDKMRAYIVMPSISFAPDPRARGGGIHPGVYISNDEIGGGRARILGATFQGLCDNGMIFGWKTDETFAQTHRWINMTTMGLLVVNAIAVAFKMSEEAAQRFIETQTVTVKQDGLKDLVNDWAKKYGLSIDAGKDWLGAALNEATNAGRREEPAIFDVVNAATSTSQNIKDFDEMQMMERMAGDMVFAYTPQFNNQER